MTFRRIFVIIYYNWKALLKYSGGSNNTLLDIFEYLNNKRLPKNKFDPAYRWSQINFTGTSFLINPNQLLGCRKDYKSSECVDYIGLASIRNYANYYLTKDRSLEIELCPLPIERVKANRLLCLEKDRIHFIYEKE